MREYIVNLTDNLIRKNNYAMSFDLMAGRLSGTIEKNEKVFILFVTVDLLTKDIRTMNPETLGRIMGELVSLPVSNAELFDGLSDDHSGTSLLMQLTAKCLAFTIYHRLDATISGVVPFVRH